MHMLDDALLLDFCQKFFGYGNFKSDTWFIGLEEGGGNSVLEMSTRLSTWAERGARPLEDAAEFHTAIGMSEFFQYPNTKRQPTWSRLIEIALCSRGQDASSNAISRYQSECWGRENGENCLLELLPLPSPSTRTWNYDLMSTSPEFQSRNQYRKAYIKARIESLKYLIEKEAPKYVIFYGKSASKQWKKIIGEIESSVSSNHGQEVFFGKTTYFLIPHPTAWRKGSFAFDFTQFGKNIYNLRKS